MLPRLTLSGTNRSVPPLGVGLWAWGDTAFWHFDPVRGPSECRAAFTAAVDAGVEFFDTAEIYGRGRSEKLLGACVRETGREIFIASKFAPYPTRWRTKHIATALARSLNRLGVRQIDLYQVHWPWSCLSIDVLMNQLADAVEAGHVASIGVCNFNASQMRRAHECLAARGLPLASNQVSYSLLDRRPERNGVLQLCRELHVVLIAYSPLSMGALTGKYQPGHVVGVGARRFVPNFRRLHRAGTILGTLAILAKQYNRTPSQIALNWLAMQQGVLPIPGARNAAQARENAGAMLFRLSEEDRMLLSRVSDRTR